LAVEAEAQAVTAHSTALELASRRTALRQVFAPGWAVLACLLVVVQAPVGLRAPVVIVFFCFVPGAALVGLLNPDSFGVELSLTVALSVAVSGLTAGILVYANLWSSTAVVVIVTVISLVAGLRDVRLRRADRNGMTLPRSSTGDLPKALLYTAERAGQAAGSLPGGIAEVPSEAGSPLQRFLLDELRHRSAAPNSGARGRRPPRTLADLEPHEVADLLSWSSLQRYVMQRAIKEVNPELWFVDDLDQGLWSQPPDERRSDTPPAPRGVWIAGVSARASIPVAWRVLEDEGKNDWRTRLALEMIDALPHSGPGGPVVAAGTGRGSLTGFRRGLIERDLPYLVRVDPITAARALAPDRPSRSAAEARDALAERIAAQPQSQAAQAEPQLVPLEGPEQLVICQLSPAGADSAFWLSNLPADTPPERLASLVQLANRGRVERATADLLQIALKMAAEEGTGLDRELALSAIALAGGLHTPDSTPKGDAER
jgi:hypothetical protein